MGWYRSKLVVSGCVVEHYEYEKPVFYDFRSKGGRAGAADAVAKLANRERVMQKARRDLKRLINANVFQYYGDDGNVIQPKFLTLTHAENVVDIPEANANFAKFVRRLNKYLGHEKNCVKYVAVIEFQKRGSIHYHVVFFNLPYIQANVVSYLWGQGFVKINKINQVDNIGAYVSKYLVKREEPDRLADQKCYFSARGLYKPLEIKNNQELERKILEGCSSVKPYEATWENENIGSIRYRQYNMNKGAGEVG